MEPYLVGSGLKIRSLFMDSEGAQEGQGHLERLQYVGNRTMWFRLPLSESGAFCPLPTSRLRSRRVFIAKLGALLPRATWAARSMVIPTDADQLGRLFLSEGESHGQANAYLATVAQKPLSNWPVL
jgi:hypothetical protein